MRSLWGSINLAVAMAVLVLFGTGGGAVVVRGLATEASLRAPRQQDATLHSGQRSGSGGAVFHGGRKSPRSSWFVLGAAILPRALRLEPPRLASRSVPVRMARLWSGPPRITRHARAPPA
jgi:hypothetical protein